MIFIQMAEGVDDDTWMYHLGKKEYSNWFRSAIHDEELADAAEKIRRRRNRFLLKSKDSNSHIDKRKIYCTAKI
jgi:hypothetical protein